MTQAKEGDRVKVHFIGSLEDGTIFGRTAEDDPFEFTLGDEKVLPAFKEAVIGMSEGETKTISVAPEDAYGPRDEELVFTADKSEIPSHITPEVGKRIRVQLGSGQVTVVTVVEIEGDKIKFDGNSPLAGEKLQFEIELLKIMQGED